MPNLYVIAGHGAGDSGASRHGYSEAERVRALAQRIKDYGGDRVGLYPFDRNCYWDDGIRSLNLPDDTQIVELHMDSADSDGARGGHVIICAGVGGADEWDRNIESFITRIFPGRSNTLVERDDLQNPWSAAAEGYGYRLVENGFISNWDDVNTFNNKIDELAKCYCEAFGIHVGGDVPAPAPTPEPDQDIPDPGGTGEFQGGKYRCTVDGLRIRKSPGLDGELYGASYNTGETVNLDNWYTIADGYVWGRYTSWYGETCYIAVGPHTGKAEPDDYLVKV